MNDTGAHTDARALRGAFAMPGLKERDPHVPGYRFYIIVRAPDGSHMYDGWAPESVTTIPAAKREALYGAMLKKRPDGEARP